MQGKVESDWKWRILVTVLVFSYILRFVKQFSFWAFMVCQVVRIYNLFFFFRKKAYVIYDISYKMEIDDN